MEERREVLERGEEPAGPPALREVEEQDQQVVEEEQGVTEQLQEREVVESQTRVSMVSDYDGLVVN